MMPNDPLVGGVALRRPAIQSPNFQTGVQGWTINADGSAEFNNLEIRGTFNGTDFIINSSGLFLYSGTPAAGNLITSLVPGTVSVTDPFGNTAQPGITVGSSSNTQIQILSIANAGIINALFNNASFSNFQIQAIAGSFAQILLQGPATTVVGFRDKVAIELNSANTPGSGNASMVMGYADDAGTLHTYLTVDAAGTHSNVTASVIATKPGTGTGPTNAATPEAWHSAALVNGWTGGGFGLKYRLLPFGDGLVEIAGDLINATATGNSICFTLPAGYRPSTAQNFPAAWNHPQASNSATPPWVFVNTNGDVQITALEAANVGVFFHIFVPLTFTN